MKKVTILFVLICALVAYNSNAQTSQGAMMLGGSLEFYSQGFQGNSDAGNSGLGFSPSFGYFVADNLAVGAGLVLSTETFDGGTTKTVVTDFGIAPFARYYKFTSNEDFAFFAQATLSFLKGKSDQTPDPVGGDVKTSTISFGVSPGFAYFFNDHWSVDFSIAGIQYVSRDPNTDVDDNKTNTFSLGISSFQPSIGLKYFF
jgi:outer membrane protein